MKKYIVSVLIICFTLSLFAGVFAAAEDGITVAFASTYSEEFRSSADKLAYETCEAWCASSGATFLTEPMPSDRNSLGAYIDTCADKGCNVIVIQGSSFISALKEAVEKHPEVTFLAYDLAQDDLGNDYSIPDNLYCGAFQKEVLGYITGYALTKLGFVKTGILMSPKTEDSIRLGYGYIQGVNAAGEELGNIFDLEMNYAYVKKLSGDADLTYSMDTWYQDGTELIFVFGNTIFTSVAEAAAKESCLIAGGITNQMEEIDASYGEGMTITSAVLNIPLALERQLQAIADGTFEGGKAELLGIVSDKEEENFIGLAPSTLFNDDFTYEDYTALLNDFTEGRITVDNDTTLEMIDMEGALNVQMFETLQF